ncbi:MAG: glycosyltransferase [Sphingomonadaceae bacterium]
MGSRCGWPDQGPNDRAFHLAVSPSPVDSEALRQAGDEWTAQLGQADRDHRPPVIGCFVGTYSSRIDLLSIVDGANLLGREQRQALRIVICGKGDLEAELVARSADNTAIILAGWQSAPKIAALMARSSFGILPYPNTPDFLASFPNKVGEYLMAGLPVMTGLAGATGDLLNRHELALPYQIGDARSVADRLSAIIGAPGAPEVHQRAADLGAEHFNPGRIYPAFADWLEQLAKPNAVPSMEALTA